MAACGGGDENGLSQSEALGRVANTFCERSLECEAESPEPLEYANVDECVASFTAALESDDQAAIEASIEAGRISWEADDAEYCARLVAEALGNLSCEDYWNENEAALGVDDPRCDTLGAGLVADGDACTIDDDCASVGSDCIDDVCTPE